jgi:prepilin-type N-terminal cleavage/methylation domain-containing protein
VSWKSKIKMQISKLQIKTQKYSSAHTTSDKRRATSHGFTLVELLVALMVTSIIFTAVATLAYALGTANDATDDRAEKEAQLRYATLRISELIKYSKLMYAASESEMVFWLDYNKDEHLYESTELVTIKKVELENGDIQLCEFNSAPEPVVLIKRCGNVQFRFDEPSLPPTKRKFVSISFDLVEDDTAHQYQINAALRGWAGHLLNETGDAIVSDDD